VGFSDVRFRFWFDDDDDWAYCWLIDDVQVVASY
jgi:hypothetical protein